MTGESLRFYPAEHPAETLVLCENLDVVDGVSSGKVEQHQGE